MEISHSPGLGSTAPANTPVRNQQLQEVASQLEASFLAEMLKSAGFGQSRSAFGGGAGEEAFSSMLVDEQAKLLVAQGGIGLSESIFKSLLAREAGND